MAPERAGRIGRRIGPAANIPNISGVILALALFLTPAQLLYGAGPGDIRLDDKIESMKKAGVGPVIFPHAAHEKRYKCADCHQKIFKDKHGANDISMKKNMDGQFCGSPNCHNSPKAFALFNCRRCHTNVRAVR